MVDVEVDRCIDENLASNRDKVALLSPKLHRSILWLENLNPNYNLEPVQTSPKQASRELQFYRFSITGSYNGSAHNNTYYIIVKLQLLVLRSFASCTQQKLRALTVLVSYTRLRTINHVPYWLPTCANDMSSRQGTKLERIMGTTVAGAETFVSFFLQCDEYFVPSACQCSRGIHQHVIIGKQLLETGRKSTFSFASRGPVESLEDKAVSLFREVGPRDCQKSKESGAIRMPPSWLLMWADTACIEHVVGNTINLPKPAFTRGPLQISDLSEYASSHLDLSSPLDDVELPNWFVTDFDAIKQYRPRLHSETGLIFCSSFGRRCVGWLRETVKAAADNVPEGISVCISSLRPSDVLQSSELHRECLFILQRQGAMNIKCDDTWNKATKRSTLLDLRTIHHGATKLSTVQGSYSLLQQTIPSGILPVYDMMDDKRNVGKLCFEEFLRDVCTTFKSLCSPYRTLGPKDRETLYLQIFRSRLRMRLPYLTSLALDGLNMMNLSSTLSPSPQLATHFWSPHSIAIGSGSILHSMLDACEKRCSPREKANTVSCATNVQHVHGITKQRKCSTDRGKCGNSMITAAKSREGNLKSVDVNKKQGSLKGSAMTAKKQNLWGAGIISPWVYYMSMGSVFCCHIEDYAFGSANAIIAPSGSHTWVVWYSIPRKDIGNLHIYLQHLMGDTYTLDCLEKRKLWLDPISIMEWRGFHGEQINVYHHLQGPSEYVVTDYGSVHWGVNLGVGWKAAVNFAYADWRVSAEVVHNVYKDLERTTGQERNYRCVPDFCSGRWGYSE